MQDHNTPLDWMRLALTNMGWPIVVGGAYWIGRYVQKAEMRAVKAEQYLTSLVERHMPAIHRALAELRGLIVGGSK